MWSTKKYKTHNHGYKWVIIRHALAHTYCCIWGGELLSQTLQLPPPLSTIIYSLQFLNLNYRKGLHSGKLFSEGKTPGDHPPYLIRLLLPQTINCR